MNIARILPLTHPQLCSQTVIFTLDQSLLVLGSVTCNSNIVLTPDQTTNNTYQRWNSPKCQWVVRILNKGDSAYRICLHVSPSEYTSGKKSIWYLVYVKQLTFIFFQDSPFSHCSKIFKARKNSPITFYFQDTWIE